MGKTLPYFVSLVKNFTAILVKNGDSTDISLLVKIISLHSSYKQNNNPEKCAGMGLNGFISKKLNKDYYVNEKKNPGPHQIAQPIQPNLGENWLNWLCYLVFSRQILNGFQNFFFLLYNSSLLIF